MKKLTYPLILIHKEGWTEQFYDLETLKVFIHNAKILFSDDGFGAFDWGSKYINNYYDYIIRDDRGLKVTQEDIYDKPYDHRKWYYRYPKITYRDKQKQRAEELGIAIPGTRCWRGGNGWRITPHHLKNIKDLYSFNEWKKEYPNIKGKVKQTPTAWDDKGRSDWSIKSWKKHRKTQYKYL